MCIQHVRCQNLHICMCWHLAHASEKERIELYADVFAIMLLGLTVIPVCVRGRHLIVRVMYYAKVTNTWCPTLILGVE